MCNAWCSPSSASPIEGVIFCTESCKASLIQWAASDMTSSKKETRKFEKETMSIKEFLQIESSLEQYNKLENIGNKGKMDWLKKGDCVTCFFHAKTTL